MEERSQRLSQKYCNPAIGALCWHGSWYIVVGFRCAPRQESLSANYDDAKNVRLLVLVIKPAPSLT